MIRQKQKTTEVKDSKEAKQVKLINSKMKFISAAQLGVKSLLIKPGRLIFTIFLSVIAFAIFGLFDTIASYNDTKTIQNVLKKSDYQAISVYQMYQPDSPYYYDSLSTSSNIVKLSASDIKQLSKESGYNFRPVYDFRDQSLTDLLTTYKVATFINESIGKNQAVEIPRSVQASVGAYYYIPEATGFVEFKDSEIEFVEIEEVKYAKVIDKNGFNLQLVAGNLPKFEYDKTAGTANTNEIAISKYLAESILYWVGGNDDPSLMNIQIMIGSTIVVDNVRYIVTGVYDTGAIPQKYEGLKDLPKSGTENSLASDFRTYLSAGLYSNFIVGEGYTNYIIKNKKIDDIEKQRIPGYYAQNQEYGIVFDNTNPYIIKPGHKTGRFYNVNDISTNKIIMFDSERNENIELADDEVLVSVEYLDDLYYFEQNHAASLYDQKYWFPFNLAYADLIQQANSKATSKMRLAVNDLMRNLKKMIADPTTQIPIPSHIKGLNITVAEKNDTKRFKVVGVYTGVDNDINNYASSYTLYPIAMTPKGLASISVNPNQGLYGRIIAPLNTSNSSTRYLAEKMTADDTRLIWYGNNALSMINEGGQMVMQFANLFLYAAIVLALFSIFMLYNYISASIIAKKRSIGVLRALGSGCKDIVSMFITESLIIAAINGALASIVAKIGCIFVNSYIRNVMNLAIDFALYDVRQVVLIILASVLTAIVSSIIPIIKISKEKPVNLIRDL